MPLPSFKKGAIGQGKVVQAVKLNFKQGLLSLIFLYDAAFCQKMRFSCNFSEKKKIYQKQSFLAKGKMQDTRKSKMQESRPYLKFNFTTYTTSPYPLGPFLKLGNGMV